jgi:hypothetical protein
MIEAVRIDPSVRASNHGRPGGVEVAVAAIPAEDHKQGMASSLENLAAPPVR